MKNILALDTATEACSVAVYQRGSVLEKSAFIPKQHSQQLLPMISQVLADCGLSLSQMNAIAFGQGPGSFTGVRIATSIAQGLAYALDLPVVPVSTLAALAQQTIRRFRGTSIISSIDARMDEVYWAVFREKNGLAVLANNIVNGEMVSSPDKLEKLLFNKLDSSWIGAGSGWRYRGRLTTKMKAYYADMFPQAQDIATLAANILAKNGGIPAYDALPQYVRNNVAAKA